MLHTHTRFIAKRCSLAVLMALGAATVAQAQNAPPANTAPVEEEIIISASRIVRSGFTAPTPTTIVGSEDIQARGAVTMNTILFDLPAMRPTTVAVPFVGNNGGNFANLRGMGALRTLVLVDGHRFVSTSIGGTNGAGLVDTNVIPTSLVERVEVVTGGASAAWGADAVAGVTNFVLKKKIDGLEGNVTYGQSTRGDTKQQSVNMAWGTDFANGRGQFMVAGEYTKMYDPLKAGDRAWGSQSFGLVNSATNTVVVNGVSVPTRIWGTNTQSTIATWGGVIIGANGFTLPATSPFRTANGGNGIQFGPGGTAQPFIYGTNATNTLMVGGNGTDFTKLLLQASPLKRKNIYARSTYDFTNNVRGFAELSYTASDATNTESQVAFMPNSNPGLVIQRDNAFLPASVRTLMTANNITNFTIGRAFRELGTYAIGGASNEVTRFAAGLDGDFEAMGKNWKWNGYITTGKTKYIEEVKNNIREANLRAAIDTVIGPAGTPICRVNSTLAADIAITTALAYQGRSADPGCVAANVFGDGSITSAVATYVNGRSHADATIKQDAGGLTLQGEPLSTWAGAVSLIGGFEYRKDSTDQTADPIAKIYTTAFPTGGWQFGNRPDIKGAITVKEYFAETVVPLLKDVPLVRSLELNAATRKTNYSTSGNVTTWKVGLTYAMPGGLLLRATKSKDIRAPNSTELFQSLAAATSAAVTDFGLPGNPASVVPSSSVGNPLLKPETADSKTVGITWEPPAIPGLHASVDIYNIFLKDNIAQFTAANVVASCYGALGFPVTPANCAFISRNAAGGISNVLSVTTNQSFQKNKGMDIELGYRFALSKVMSEAKGNLSLRLLGTYLDEFTTNNFLTSIDAAGTVGLPHWRWTTNATYTNGPLQMFVQGRYAEPVILSATPLATDLAINNLPSHTVWNGSVQYALWDNNARGRLALFVNVNNILDKDPPAYPSGAPHINSQAALAPDYDKVGRAFTLGVRFSY